MVNSFIGELRRKYNKTNQGFTFKSHDMAMACWTYGIANGKDITIDHHNDTLGGSRKYPYPYHGRHLGIPKGRGGYVDWNSEDMGGLRRLEFRGHGEGSLDWNSEGIREFSGE